MKKLVLLIDEKTQNIYEEFRCELGIHEKDIVKAQNLHRDLLEKNPFRYESPFLISAVCVYAISHSIPQKVTIEDIENIIHIKKDDILKCYSLIDSDTTSFVAKSDDDIIH